MNLYLFLSVIIVCITIIICVIISNFVELSEYRTYRDAYYKLQKVEKEYNNLIQEYSKTTSQILSTMADIKNIINK